jgi:hypothetical protein
MLVILAFLAPPVDAATGYYVDKRNGSNHNAGTSPNRAWKTLRAVRKHNFGPGDVIHFRRGCTWTGSLVIDNSGRPNNPITFTAYGEGARPVITNPGSPSNWTQAIRVEANWIVIEGLLIRDAYEVGILLADGAHHNVIRDVEITDTGGGIGIDGQYNLVTECYIHDLHMVVDSPGGNDDYGAVGIWIYDSNNEISYNRLENCKATSCDYGEDGGAIEWWGRGKTIEGSYVHHNWSTGNTGFFEVGSKGGTVKDTVVAYNVSVNDDWFALFGLAGSFATDVKGFRIEHNTIVHDEPASNWSCCALIFVGYTTPKAVALRNNIFYLRNWNFSYSGSFVHEHNLYGLVGKAHLGIPLGPGEIVAYPKFVDRRGRDFRLRRKSVAIDQGLHLGHDLDHADHLVPRGQAPDLGAFEYTAADNMVNATPTRTPTTVPSPTPTETRQPTSTATPRPTDTPTSRFGFTLSYGTCYTETVDTFEGVYTRDADAHSATVSITFTEQQMTTIQEKAAEIGFFDYPDVYEISVPPGQPRGVREPAFTFQLSIQDGPNAHTVRWKDDIFYPTEPKADRLRALITLIQQTVQSHPAIEELPPLPAWCL